MGLGLELVGNGMGWVWKGKESGFCFGSEGFFVDVGRVVLWGLKGGVGECFRVLVV